MAWTGFIVGPGFALAYDEEIADGVDLRGGEADTIRGTTYEKPGGWSTMVFIGCTALICSVKACDRMTIQA